MLNIPKEHLNAHQGAAGNNSNTLSWLLTPLPDCVQGQRLVNGD